MVSSVKHDVFDTKQFVLSHLSDNRGIVGKYINHTSFHVALISTCSSISAILYNSREWDSRLALFLSQVTGCDFRSGVAVEGARATGA
jgi:hypothetical protein